MTIPKEQLISRIEEIYNTARWNLCFGSI